MTVLILVSESKTCLFPRMISKPEEDVHKFRNLEIIHKNFVQIKNRDHEPQAQGMCYELLKK